VERGERPFRPTHDLSRDRGLNDTVWKIINACWDQEPEKRYSASRVVLSLRDWLDRPDDYRPLNDFDRALPSQVLSSDRIDHPFSTLEPNDEDAEMNELKWISREVGDSSSTMGHYETRPGTFTNRHLSASGVYSTRLRRHL
jgi:hypothetical protein